MADIFISYSRADKEWVRRFAGALQRFGYDVWWDPSITPGEEFRELIQRELNAAKAVIVVWSENSYRSRWVHDEAAVAAERGNLIAVRIDDTPIPLGLRSFHVADFSSWKGNDLDPEFRSLTERLKTLDQADLHSMWDRFADPLHKGGDGVADETLDRMKSVLPARLAISVGGLQVHRLLFSALILAAVFAAFIQLDVIVYDNPGLRPSFWVYFSAFFIWVLALRIGILYVTLSRGMIIRNFFDRSFSLSLLWSVTFTIVLVLCILFFSTVQDVIAFIAEIPTLVLMVMSVVVFVRVSLTFVRFLLTKV